jgi:hypothetical protein
MSLDILDKAQNALAAYQTYQLRLAMALSLIRLRELEETTSLTIGDAVKELNTNVGISIDGLAFSDAGSRGDCMSFLDRVSGFACQHPLVLFHLRSICEDLSSQLIKDAIKAHPDCEHLYQILNSPHHNFLGNDPETRRKCIELFGDSVMSRFERRLYFSPMLQISIGHWFHLCNSIQCAIALRGDCPPITVFTSDVDSGLSLIDTINISGSANVDVAHHDSALNYPLAAAQELYNSDYYLAFIPPRLENDLQMRIAAAREKKTTTNTVYIHLRTPTYKGDGHSYHASIRNVDPDTYIGAISYLKVSAHIEPILVTADLDVPRGLPLTIHQVTDRGTELRQWEIVREACFSVGTASGLSHLFNLGDGHTLRTNSNGLALDDFFTDRHLVVCKRFMVSPHILNTLSKEQLAYTICLPWEITNGLASFSAIKDLSNAELIDAAIEYIGIYHALNEPYTLYSLFDSLGLTMLKGSIPNRNIAKSTATDIKQALLAYPC